MSLPALQTDRTVRKIADYISRKVGDRLKELYRDRREEYISIWQDVGPLSNSALSTTKFKKQVEDIIIYRTTTMRQGRQEQACIRDSSCAGAIPGGRRLARCNPIPKPYS